jgi:toxin ParE1/3/4
VRFHPAAQTEYVQAIVEIETERRGYGRRFEKRIEKKLRQAVLWPSSGEKVEGFSVLVRRFVIRDFPYTLIVATIDDKQEIVAVAHAKRHPDYWHERVH